jgi:hypothetical protein
MDSIFDQNQEVPMRTRVLLAILGLLASIFAVNLSSPPSAKSVETCFIKANTRDVYVIVYDEDRRGNKGYELWKGWIRQGTERRIDTDSGHIRYHYALSDTQPLSGDIGRLCNSGGSIGVP